MKKKVIVGLCVFLAAVFLFPITYHLKDGGTIVYQAVLYDVHKVHQMNPADSEWDYLEGTIVEILGFEVFNNVK